MVCQIMLVELKPEVRTMMGGIGEFWWARGQSFWWQILVGDFSGRFWWKVLVGGFRERFCWEDAAEWTLMRIYLQSFPVLCSCIGEIETTTTLRLHHGSHRQSPLPFLGTLTPETVRSSQDWVLNQCDDDDDDDQRYTHCSWTSWRSDDEKVSELLHFSNVNNLF